MKRQTSKPHRPRRAWSKLRRLHLSLFPICQICGSSTALEVHHIVPFHIDPSKYLQLSNLVTLCGAPYGGCHLHIGHNGNYSFHNLNIKNYVHNSK